MRWRRGTAELPQQMVRRVLLCPSMLAVSERARTKELTAHVACGQRCVHAARPAFTGSAASWQPSKAAVRAANKEKQRQKIAENLAAAIQLAEDAQRKQAAEQPSGGGGGK